MKKAILMMMLIGLSLLMISCNPKDADPITLAQCLTEKGAVMYGTNWCGHCQNQKELFGDAFSEIDFVDCDQNSEECNNAGIRGYPTWKINGENYPGARQLTQLAQLAGC